MLYCFAERPSFFGSNSENDRVTVCQCKFFQFLFSTHVNRCFDTLDWRNLQNDKEIAQSPKMIPERIKILEIEITLSQIIPLEARYPVVKTVKISFWLKALIFSNLKLRRRLKHCAVFQKLFNLKILERYVDCSFDNHAGIFSLKTKKTSP